MEPTSFAAGLGNNRSGRILANHLAAVEVVATTGGHCSAVSEALGNEQTFLCAINAWVSGKLGCPCGLPTPLPRFIAIVNLSGERMLLHSNQPELITSLCRHSSALRPDELAERLREFEQYPAVVARNVNRFVLLTYSMPWQCGVDGAFWHLSACNISMVSDDAGVSTPRLADRVLTFSGTSAASYKGKQTHASEFQQIQDFVEAYSTTCLDHAAPSPKLADVANARLLGIMQELTRGRAADQTEIRTLKSELASVQMAFACFVEATENKEQAVAIAHKKETDKLHSSSAEKMLLCKNGYGTLRAEMATIQQSLNKCEIAKLRELKAHEKLVAKSEDVARQSACKDKLHNAASNSQRAEIAKLETRLEAMTLHANTLKTETDKEHAILAMQQQTLHAETLAKVNATLASKEQLLNQLSDNNERLNVEALSLRSYGEEQAATIARMQSVRHTATETCNASTATHHCASTQKDFDPSHQRVPTYQSAIDTLQQLVLKSQRATFATPLPYPHFTPYPPHHR